MKKIILILFISISSLLSAQTTKNNKFQIGLGFKSPFLIENSDGFDNNKFIFVLPIPLLNISLNFKYILDSNYSLRGKIGYAIPVFYYNGLEFGISVEYLFKNNFYTTLGFLQHNNGGNTDEGWLAVNIPFVDIGAGYQFGKSFSVEVVYFYPIKEAVYWNGSENAPYEKNPKYMRKIESMISLNFILVWDLF